MALFTRLFLTTGGAHGLGSVWSGQNMELYAVKKRLEESMGMSSSPPPKFKAQVGYGGISSEFTAVWVLSTVQCCIH